jgi:hypothetical protein
MQVRFAWVFCAVPCSLVPATIRCLRRCSPPARVFVRARLSQPHIPVPAPSTQTQHQQSRIKERSRRRHESSSLVPGYHHRCCMQHGPDERRSPCSEYSSQQRAPYRRKLFRCFRGYVVYGGLVVFCTVSKQRCEGAEAARGRLLVSVNTCAGCSRPPYARTLYPHSSSHRYAA